MRLLPNGCRELHWHESAEWAYMLAGKARVTCIDYDGKAFVDDVGPGDLWYFRQRHPPLHPGRGRTKATAASSCSCSTTASSPSTRPF